MKNLTAISKNKELYNNTYFYVLEQLKVFVQEKKHSVQTLFLVNRMVHKNRIKVYENIKKIGKKSYV